MYSIIKVDIYQNNSIFGEEVMLDHKLIDMLP